MICQRFYIWSRQCVAFCIKFQTGIWIRCSLNNCKFSSIQRVSHLSLQHFFYSGLVKRQNRACSILFLKNAKWFSNSRTKFARIYDQLISFFLLFIIAHLFKLKLNSHIWIINYFYFSGIAHSINEN